MFFVSVMFKIRISPKIRSSRVYSFPYLLFLHCLADLYFSFSLNMKFVNSDVQCIYFFAPDRAAILQ